MRQDHLFALSDIRRLPQLRVEHLSPLLRSHEFDKHTAEGLEACDPSHPIDVEEDKYLTLLTVHHSLDGVEACSANSARIHKQKCWRKPAIYFVKNLVYSI